MSLPSIRQGIETGLTPNLNQMSVMGLVSIPGMLTGQILAGTSPLVAAKYQIVIMFFICSNSMTILLSTLCQAVYLRLFDYDRFHSQVIQERKGGKPKDSVLALCSKAAELLRLLSTRKGGDEHGVQCTVTMGISNVLVSMTMTSRTQHLVRFVNLMVFVKPVTATAFCDYRKEKFLKGVSRYCLI
jgi:hypothetical protein